MSTREVKSAIQAALEGNDSLLRTIPADVLRLTADYLDSKSLLRLCQSSTYFRKTVCQSDAWRKRVINELTDNPQHLQSIDRILEDNKKSNQNPMSYLQLYLLFRDASPEHKLTMSRRFGFDKFLLPRIYPLDQLTLEKYQLIYFNEKEIDLEHYQNYIEQVVIPSLSRYGHLDMLEDLIAKGYHTTYAGEDGVQSGSREIMQFLIDHRDPDYEYFFPLVLLEATRMRDRDMIDFLLENGAQINDTDRTGHYPLLSALRDYRDQREDTPSDLDFIKFLVERGAVIDDPEEELVAIEHSKDINLYRYLFEEQEYPKHPDILGTMMVSGYEDIVDFLLDDPNIFDVPYYWALQWATPRMAKHVLDRDPNIDFRFAFINLAQRESPFDDTYEIFRYLIERGGNIDDIRYYGQKPNEVKLLKSLVDRFIKDHTIRKQKGRR